MTQLVDDFRQIIQDRVPEMLRVDVDDDDDREIPDTGVVTAFVVIAEVASPDGSRWVVWEFSRDTAKWTIRGMLQELDEELR